MSEQQTYHPGDVANGHILGSDGKTWTPIADGSQSAPAAPGAPQQIVMVREKSNWAATTALVLGIIALVVGWIPFLGMVGIIIGFISVPFVIVAFVLVSKRGGLVKAIIAAVLTALALIVSFAVQASTVAAVDEAVTSIDSAVNDAGKYTAEVGTPSVEFGTTTLPVKITNSTTEEHSYFLTVIAESPNGAKQYDTTVIAVTDLAPGQTTSEDALFLKNIPADAKFSVTD